MLHASGVQITIATSRYGRYLPRMLSAGSKNCLRSYQRQGQHLAILFPERRSTRKRSCLAKTKELSGCFRVVAFKNFGDGLLDYIEAGPKLRKWYGEGERRPQDGGEPEQEEPESEGSGDAILVTDADSRMGELIILQLILARLKVVALVKDAVAAHTAFGDYVTPVQGSSGDASSLAAAMRSARSVICPGRLGALPTILRRRQPDHVILLSAVGTQQAGLFGKLLGGEQAVLADPAREEAFSACSVPLTIVRVGRIVDAPGGAAELNFSQDPAETATGEMTREDVAQVLVRALQKRPKATLTFTVNSQSSGEQRRDWDRLFAGLKEASLA